MACGEIGVKEKEGKERGRFLSSALTPSFSPTSLSAPAIAGQPSKTRYFSFLKAGFH